MISERRPTGRLLLANIRWSIADRVGRTAIQLGLIVVLARFLGPEDFGVVAIAQVVTGLLEILIDLGTGQAVVQRKTVGNSLLTSVHLLNLIIGAVGAGVVLAVAPWVGAVLQDEHVAPVLRVLAFTLPVTAAGVVHRALLMRRMQFDRVAMVTLGGLLTQAAVAIPLAALGFGVWALVWSVIGSSCISTLALWKASAWRPTGAMRSSELRSVARFSLNLTAFNVFGYCTRRADQAIIGGLLGTGELGLYSMTQRVTRQGVRPLAGAMDPVLFAHLSKAERDEEISTTIRRAIAGVALVLLPAMVGLAVVAEPFVRVVLGAKWEPIIPLVRVFAPVVALNAIVARTNTIFRAKGRTDLLFYWGVASGLVTLTSYLIGVSFGVLGVAIAYGVGRLLLAVPGVLIPARLISLRGRALLGAVGSPALATAGMVALTIGTLALLRHLSVSDPLRLAGSVTVGVAAYVGFVSWLRPRSLEDLRRALMPSLRPPPAEGTET